MSESGVLVANNPDGVVLRGSRGHRVPHLGMVYRRVFGLGKGRVVDWRYNLWLRPRLSLSTHADHHDAMTRITAPITAPPMMTPRSPPSFPLALLVPAVGLADGLAVGLAVGLADTQSASQTPPGS